MMALLEEVCHFGGGLCGLMYAQAMPSETDHFLLSVSQGVGLSSTSSASYMLARHCVKP